MIWILRNIGVRLWITTLCFIPLGFYLMPRITIIFPGINPVWILLAMMAGFIPAMGLLLDMAGKNAVANLIKEGQAWERAGINTKAEKKFNRALRLYDTFLFGLFSARRTARKISAALARFKLNTSVGNENFNLAAAMYLKMHPRDEAMAERWLRQAQKSRRLDGLDQEILTLLAETYYSHKNLSALLADIFQKSGRRDYVAKKLYPPEQKPPSFAKAYPKTLGAALADPGETLEKQKPYSPPEVKPAGKVRRKKRVEVGAYLHAASETAGGLIQSAIGLAGSVFSFLGGSVLRVYGFVKERERIQFYLKTGIMGMVFIGLMVFIINTVSHMVKPQPAPAEK